MPPRSSLAVLEGGTVAFNADGSTYDATTLTKAKVDVAMLRSEISKYAFADKGGRMPDTQPFNAVFEQEMRRVMRFVDDYQNNLEFTAKSLLTNAEVTVEQVSKHELNGHTMIHELSQQMEDLVESCLELQNFLTKARLALLDVAQKADAQLKSQCTNLVNSSLKNNINSVLVVVASDIYAAIRSAEKKLNRKVSASEDDGVWKAPSSFQRSTTKYWVKEEQLTKLLLSCAGEAPLLVYGKKGTLTPKSDRLTRVSEGDKLWASMVTPITSVYFDSPNMSMYKKRLARVEGAELLRARWYGPSMPKGDGIIFLELKTHHEKWVRNQSVKERAAVQEKDMKFFLQPVPWSAKEAQEMILRASPTLTGDELTKAANLLYRMHRLVVKHKLRACVRSVYMRAAFQSAKSNGT
jgi:SPX domain protein involved in polyphosphate accumulation